MHENVLADVEATVSQKPMQPPFGMNYREWLTARRDLQIKKSKAREKVVRVAKNSLNPIEGYRSVEAADVYDLMRPILAEVGLGFEVEQTTERMEYAKSGAPITKVDMTVTFMDLDTGYFEQKTITGAGLDWQDKGIYKAFTGATKYALILEFLIPTGNDPMPGTGDPETNETRRGEEAADAEEPKTEPGITPKQVATIKLKIDALATAPGQTPAQKRAGIKAIYSSLKLKLKLSKEDESVLTELTNDQAEKVILLLDEWIGKREQVEEREKAKQEQTAGNDTQ